MSLHVFHSTWKEVSCFDLSCLAVRELETGGLRVRGTCVDFASVVFKESSSTADLEPSN